MFNVYYFSYQQLKAEHSKDFQQIPIKILQFFFLRNFYAHGKRLSLAHKERKSIHFTSNQMMLVAQDNDKFWHI